MLLLIDNYDSFSYNLYQLVGSMRPDIRVIRNDELSVDDIRALAPDRIIISPGPGRPENAGMILEAVQKLGSTIPMLGVCLGHQAICAAYGGTITYAKHLMHGKQSKISVRSDTALFRDVPADTTVARYHSLAVDPSTLPAELELTATTEDGEIMAVQHREYPVYGMQFHPESFMTPEGSRMLHNFLTLGQ